MDKKLKDWIDTVQEYQKLSDIEVSTTEELTEEWKGMNKSARSIATASATFHVIIARMFKL